MEPTEPSFIDKTKNFANFSWDIMNYLRKNGADSLVVSKETYETRHEICKSCEMWIKKKDMVNSNFVDLMIKTFQQFSCKIGSLKVKSR